MQRIFVGDVQGCGDEFLELVARATAAFGDQFALWMVGDLLNRGPDNRRPLELVRGLVEAGRAQYVLGNHEISFLAVGFGLRDLGPNDTFGDVLSGSDATEWIDWLRARPLVVPGQIGAQRFAMLHAASDPDWSLAELVAVGNRIAERLSAGRDEAREFLAADTATDPLRDALARITRCRSVTGDGAWSSDEPSSPDRAWHRVWRSRGHDHALVYGHWARQGLHVEAGLRGLDTGCVHHGRGRDGFLTAWLPESSPEPGPESNPDAKPRRAFDLPDDRFWQIPAKRRYYDPASS